MNRLISTLALFLGAAAFATGGRAETETGSIDSSVWVAEEGGYHTYRIPSVIEARNGDLLAFCEGRKESAHDAGDIDLIMKRSTDGGRSWSATQVIWDDGGNTCGNPCPVVDAQTETIWLPMTWNAGDVPESHIRPGFGEDSRRVFITHSNDHGRTWAASKEITERVKSESWSWYATGPGAGIQLQKGPHAGRLLIPCDHKEPLEQGGSAFYSHVFYSDDHGQSWHLGGRSEPGGNECEVVELADPAGRLMLNMRNGDRSQRTRLVALSDDGGRSWGDQHHAAELIEPICQASIRRFRWPTADSHGVLLFSNPASKTQRIDLTLRISPDEGETWPFNQLIHGGFSAYSCLVALGDGDVGVIYERDSDARESYGQIRFERFPLPSLEARTQSADAAD